MDVDGVYNQPTQQTGRHKMQDSALLSVRASYPKMPMECQHWEFLAVTHFPSTFSLENRGKSTKQWPTPPVKKTASFCSAAFCFSSASDFSVSGDGCSQPYDRDHRCDQQTMGRITSANLLEKSKLLTRERLGIHISIRVQWFFPRIRASFQVPHIKSCP